MKIASPEEEEAAGGGSAAAGLAAAAAAGLGAAAAGAESGAAAAGQQRRVTIVGGPEAQWKAQYLIFQKLREEGFASGNDDIRLTVEITVPSPQVSNITPAAGVRQHRICSAPGGQNYRQGRHECSGNATNYRGCDKTSRAG